MDYLDKLRAFKPANEQETRDKALFLRYAEANGDILLRSNEIAHVTSSGFVMNPTLDKVLLVHHNIRGVWSWTGGHADGDGDLLQVALREAWEETGVSSARPLFEDIASVDILWVAQHMKNGRFVNSHLHLSIAYVLVCGEDDALQVREGENTAVRWFPVSFLTPAHFSEYDVYLYRKLIQRARAYPEAAAVPEFPEWKR